MDKKKFGGPKGPRKLGEGDVKKILDGNGGPTPILPSYSDIKKNLGEELVARQPKLIDKALVRQVGVGDRKGGAPVDDDLRRTRILGGREPIRVGGGGLGTGIGGATGTGIGGANGTGIGGGNGTGIGGPTRQTGAIRRDPIKMPAPGPTPRNGDGRLPDPILPPNPGNGEETVRRTREPIKVPAPDPTRRGNNGRIPDPLPPNPGNGDDNRRTREPIKIAPPDPKGTREPIRIEQPPRETRRSDPPPKVDRPPDKPKDTPPPKQQEPPKKEAPAPSKIEHKGKPDGI